MYPVVYFDALQLKIRDEGSVTNNAVYLTLAIRAAGENEVLELRLEQAERPKLRLMVFNEIRNRELHQVQIALVDGLRGFPKTIETVYTHRYLQGVDEINKVAVAYYCSVEGACHGD